MTLPPYQQKGEIEEEFQLEILIKMTVLNKRVCTSPTLTDNVEKKQTDNSMECT